MSGQAEVEAVVKKKSGKTGEGRGFSREELKEVGLDFRQALSLHLRVDARRKTKHAENVKALKLLLRKK